MSDFQDTPDEFTGIFDDLNPADFAVQTTARVETYLPGSPNVGDDAFIKFVDHNIEVLRTSALAASGNDINPVATLASASTQWIFAPEPDENMGDYVARLHDEAKRLGANWCFISRFTQVAASPAGTFDPSEGIDNNDRGELMQAAGQLERGVVFYAAKIEDGEHKRRHGIMLVEGSGLTPPVFGNPEQPFEIFDAILEE